MKRRILLAALACALSWVLSVSALASGYPAPQDLGYTVSYAKVEWVHQYGGAVQLLQGLTYVSYTHLTLPTKA